MVGGLLAGRPVLVVTGHFGNWEMAGYVLGLFGFSTYAIARRIDNPYIDRFLRSFRATDRPDHSRQERRLRPHPDGAGRRRRAGDARRPGRRPARPVRRLLRPARLDAQGGRAAGPGYNVPLMVIGHAAVGEPMHYQIVAEDLILPEEYAGRPDAVRRSRSGSRRPGAAGAAVSRAVFLAAPALEASAADRGRRSGRRDARLSEPEASATVLGRR